MARIRLTKRTAATNEIPYPGSVNQPDRKDKDMEQYHTFEQTVNHELPDMRTEWKNDQRNDIGFGIPTVASIRAAASKAVKLAVLFLGDKVAEDVVEAQARDFMKMGSESLNESIKRFADSETFYKKAEEKVEEKKEVEAKKAEDKVEEKVEEKKAANPIENLGDKKAPAFTKDDAKKAEDKVEEPKVEAKKAEEKVEEKVEAKKAEDKKEEAPVEAKKAEDKEEEKVEAKKAEDKEEVEEKKAGEMDIDLTAGEDEDEKCEAGDDKEDEVLAKLFAGDDEEDKEEEKVEAKKAKIGIEKLGGQPKMASSNSKEVDLSNLWNSAPDVSKLFE